MRKIYSLFLLLLLVITSKFSTAQVTIAETFDGTATPTGWVYSGFSRSTTTPCTGAASLRGNRYSLSTTGNIVAPAFTSNGTNLTINYSYKVLNFTGGTAVPNTPAWGTITTEVSINGGTSYTIVGTQSAANHVAATTCATIATITVPGASVPNASNMRVRLKADWLAGDYYVYFDNVNITQVGTTPPNCIPLPTSPTNGATGVVSGALSWPAATGAPTGYRVYVGTDGGGTTTPTNLVNAFNNGTSTSYTAAGLLANTTYYWQVLPFNANGPSTGCAIWSFTTGAPACSATPTPANAATNINRNATLSFTSSVGAVSYNIYFGTSATPPLVGNQTGLTFQPPMLMAATTTYYWKVEPVGLYGTNTTCTVWSFTTGTTIAPYCIPVTSSGCTDGDVIARVILNTLDNNSGTGCPSGLAGYSDYTTNTALTTTLNAGTQYGCTVFAGQYSEGYAAWIDYNDDNVFSATERIGFSVGQVAGSGTVGVLGSSATFPISLACNPPVGTHRLRVRAMYNIIGSAVTPCGSNSFGETEDYVITIAPPPPCPQPSALTSTDGTPNTTTEILSWVNGCVETIWDVQVQAQGAGVPTGTPTFPGVTSNPFTVTGLTAGTIYEYYVRAVCTPGSLNSAWSGPYLFNTTLPCSPGLTPANGATGVGPVATGIPLTWTSIPGATSYDLYFGTTSPGVLLGNTGGTTINITGTTFSTVYYWYIVPKDALGDAVGCASNVFSFTTQAPPPPPPCLTAADYLTPAADATNVTYQPNVNFSWNNVTGATSYKLYITAGAPPTVATTLVATVTALTGTTTNYQWTGATGSTQYTWYVEPANGTNANLTCGVANTFTTAAPPATPANDDCSGAIAITVGNGFCTNPVTGTTVGATVSTTPASLTCTSSTQSDVWFTLTVPAGQTIIVQTSSVSPTGVTSGNDFTMSAIHSTDNTCSGTFSLKACDDDSNPEVGANQNHARISVNNPSTSDSTYFIVVKSYSALSINNFAVCAWNAASTMVVAPGTNNACTPAATSLTISTANGNTHAWTPVRDATNQIVAEIKANGNDLGLISSSYFTSTTTPLRAATQGGFYMNRNIAINVQNQPTVPVDVRLYFTNTEKSSLDAAVPAANDRTDIRVTKEDGTCATTFQGNLAGIILPQVSNAAYLTDHYVQVSVSSFSDFFLHKGALTLPVGLTNLRGAVTGATNTVYWTTTTEVNNRKFVVQRSANGANFSNIGEVTTQAMGGNSSTALNYTFVDAAPLTGKAYYRLQVVDNANGIKNSGIVTLRRGAGQLEIVDVKPNPTTGTVYFNVLGTSTTINVNVLDLSGKTVIRKGLVQTTNFSVDMSKLANGMYILQAIDDQTGEKALFKVLKN